MADLDIEQIRRFGSEFLALAVSETAAFKRSRVAPDRQPHQVRHYSRRVAQLYAWVQTVIVRHMKSGIQLPSTPASGAHGLGALPYQLLTSKPAAEGRQLQL